MNRSSRSCSLLALAALFVASPRSAVADGEYEVTDIPVVSISINSAGAVMGQGYGPYDPAWAVVEADGVVHQVPSNISPEGLTDPSTGAAIGLVWGNASVEWTDPEAGSQTVEQGVVWNPSTNEAVYLTPDGTARSHLAGLDTEGWAYLLAWDSPDGSGQARAFALQVAAPDTPVEIDLGGLASSIAAVARGRAAFVLTDGSATVLNRASEGSTVLEGGDLDHPISVFAVNASGAVAGSIDGAPAYWSPAGALTSFDVPPDRYGGRAFAITDSGWVLGVFIGVNGGEFPFVWRDGDADPLDLTPEFQQALDDEALPGTLLGMIPADNAPTTMQTRITEAGLVVGRFWFGDFGDYWGDLAHVFAWDEANGFVDLTPEVDPNGYGGYSWAMLNSVSPSGVVVYGRTYGGPAEVWRRTDGVVTDLTVSTASLWSNDFGLVPTPTRGRANVLGQFVAFNEVGDRIAVVTPPGATSAGTDQTVQPDANTSITFAGIVTPGETSVVSYDIDDPDAPTVPADFSLAGTGALINISTTATFSGSIELAIHYDDTGMSAARENQIRLLHFVDPQWVDATDYSRSGGYLDTVNDIIYGKVTSLSPFAIVEALDTAPPVIAAAPDVNADATSTLGAVVTFETPTATDAVDGTVGVTCSPASGTLFPVGVTTVTCTAFDARHNAATTTFDVTVRIDPRYLKGAVAEALNALIPTSDKPTVKKLLRAIKDIEDSLAPELWVDDFHLTEKGRKVFKEESDAVADLIAITNPAQTVLQAIASLVEADRVLAKTAIDEATAANPTSSHLSTAASEMTLAYSSNASGEFRDAIKHYRKAWKAALKAQGVT